MKQFICKICDKQYKTSQTLCNHNRRFHKSNIRKCVTTNIETPKTITTNIEIVTTNIEKHIPVTTLIQTNNEKILTKYFCKYCNRGFGLRQNKWLHENKYCKIKKEMTNITTPTIINNENI